jgi:hypothetical protein
MQARRAQGQGRHHALCDLDVPDDKLNMLAEALQTPARQLSRQTCLRHTPPAALAVAVMPPPPATLKKASRSKLSFGKPTPPARTTSAMASNVLSPTEPGQHNRCGQCARPARCAGTTATASAAEA